MKRLFSLLLVLIIIMAQVPVRGLAVNGMEGEMPPLPEIPRPPEVPNLMVTSSNTYTAEPGDTVDVRVELKNTSRYDATNISASLKGSSTGMAYVEGSSYDSLRSLRGGKSSTLSFKVKVDPSAPGGNQDLTLDVSYYNDPYWGDTPTKYDLQATVNIRVSKDESEPQIIVKRVDILPSTKVKAGDIIAVGFDLENIGKASANDVKFTLEGLSNEGFTLARGVNQKTIQFIGQGKKAYVYFDLKSGKNLPAGSYELKLKLTYRNSKNEIIEDESKFFISLEGKSPASASNLVLENLKYPIGPILQNKEVNIGFQIRNQGQSDAKNIVIEATSSDPVGIVPKSVSIIKVNNLKPGGVKDVSFTFLTTKSSETRNYPIEITVSYEKENSPEGELESFSQFVGIFSQAPEPPKEPEPPGPPGEPGKQPVPKLIIDNYSFNPDMVKAGEKFDMHLSFYNTNSSKAVKNIKIFLTSESGSTDPESANAGSSVFTPVDSSNTFYIDSIAPKARVEKKITMFTVPDALAKTHTITANFEYEDSSAEPFTATELIGVPVIQQSRLEIGEINYFPDASVGQPMPISLEFYNTGRVTLYNLMVKLEGDFNTENGQYYVGNFESGASDYFDGSVIAMEEGPLKGEIVFTYEDPTGETQELRESFNFQVMDMPPMEEFPEDYDPEMDGQSSGIMGILKSKWLWIPLILIALIGGALFLKKRKDKKDEEMSLDE